MLWTFAAFGAICLHFALSAVVLPSAYRANLDDIVDTDHVLDLRTLDRRTDDDIEAFPVTVDGDVLGYYIKATIKDQEYKLQYDTGSDDTWIISTEITNPGFANFPKYPWNPAWNSKEPTENSYADGTEISGVIKRTNFNIGTRSVTKFPLLILNKYIDPKNVASDTHVNGLVGADMDGESLFESEIYSLDFNPEDSGKKSYIKTDISAINKDEGTVLNIVPSENGKWLLDSKKLGHITIDSGSPGVWIDESLIVDYLCPYPSKPPTKDEPVWWVKCNEDLGPFEFDLKDSEVSETFQIPGSRLKRTPINEGDEWCIIWLRGESEDPLLGLPFIDQHVVTFDKSEDKIGIKKKN